MKKILVLILMFAAGFSTYAQVTDTNEAVINETQIVREVPSFNAIDIRGSKISLYVKQAETQSVKIDAPEKSLENIVTEVENNTLIISSQKVAKEVSVYVDVVSLNAIYSSHIAKIFGEGTFKTDKFSLVVAGTSEITLSLDVDELKSDLSGAAELSLSGNADVHFLNVSGAAEIDAANLTTNETVIDISGAGDAKVHTKDKISGEISGAAQLVFFGEPDVSEVKVTGAAVIKGKGEKEIAIGGTGSDTVDFKIGNYKFKITEEEDKDKKDKKKKKDDITLWQGIDIGVTGYLNSDNKIEMPLGYEYLDLNYAKSIEIGFNLFEKDIPIVKNYFELVSGLGFEINNYKFSNNTALENNPDQLTGYIDSVNSYSKTKLRVSYLTIPLLIEVNTNSDPKKAIHFAGGLLCGLNIGAKTKVVYENNGKKEKSKDDHHYFTQPFRYGLTARIGYGESLMLYANYSMASLFKENKGPELYPFTVGLSFVGL